MIAVNLFYYMRWTIYFSNFTLDEEFLNVHKTEMWSLKKRTILKSILGEALNYITHYVVAYTGTYIYPFHLYRNE